MVIIFKDLFGTYKKVRQDSLFYTTYSRMLDFPTDSEGDDPLVYFTSLIHKALSDDLVKESSFALLCIFPFVNT